MTSFLTWMEDECWPAGQVKREKAVATDGKDEEDNVLNTSLTPPIPLLPSSFPSFHLLPPSFPPNCPILSFSSPPSLFTHQTPAICWMITGKIHLSSAAHSTWSEIIYWQKNYSKTLSKLTYPNHKSLHKCSGKHPMWDCYSQISVCMEVTH